MVNEKQLEEKYRKLPEALKNALFSTDSAMVIERVGRENKFSRTQTVQLAEITGQVLLGILPPDRFPKTLEKELKIQEGVASKTTERINYFIFSPVKESLNQLYKNAV